MLTLDIGPAFLRFYHDLGYSVVPGGPLLDPSVPMSFVMSAGLTQVEVLQGRNHGQGGQAWAFVQRCFRHFDIDKVGSDDLHLSLFHMPGALVFGEIRRDQVIARMWHLLTRVLRMEADRLWVSYLSGGEKGGHLFDADRAAQTAWLALGLTPSHVVGLGPEHNVWIQGNGIHGQNERHKAGPSTEVFWDRGPQVGCGAACAPGCPCGRFVEVANTLFVDLELDAMDGRMHAMSVPFSETVVGVERLAMILQRVGSVFHIDNIEPIRSAISRFVPPHPSSLYATERSSNLVADHIRALVFLVADGAPPPGKDGRARLVKILIRRILTHKMILGAVTPEFLPTIIDSVMQGHDSQEFQKARDTLLSYFRTESHKFEDTVARAKVQLDKFIAGNNGGSLTGDQIVSLEKHFGMPHLLIEHVLTEKGLA